MSARISGLHAVAERAGELRATAAELAELELHAFAPVLAALRLPRDDPGRAAAVAGALSSAADSPLRIARTAAELAELGERTAQEGKASVRGDVLAGRDLARAVTSAAARLVVINLEGNPGDPRIAEARRLGASAPGKLEP